MAVHVVGAGDSGQHDAAAQVAGTGHAEWVKVNDLVVDASYQRDVHAGHVANIAENFNPNLLGAIDVAKRHNGTYYVMDGQHRVLALRQRGMGDHMVLCNVWLSDGPQFEAEVFIGKNDNRKPMPPYSRYRARVKAGVPNEVAVKTLMDRLGIQVVPSQGRQRSWGGAEEARLWCIGTVCEMHAALPRLTEKALSMICDTWKFELQAFDANIVKGLIIFMAEHEGEFDPGRLKNAMLTSTPSEVLDQAWQLKSNRTYGAATFLALVLTDLYNHKNNRDKIVPRMAKTYSFSIRGYLQRHT